MKISRPGSPQTSGLAEGLSSASPSKGKGFAAKLDNASAKASVSSAHAKPADAVKSTAVSDIGTDLKAGRISPQVAIDKVIDRIVARQLGIHAAPAAKEQIGAALRERLADDPLLAAKVRALSEE
jgi:hypothetical protein